jgi:phosphatidate cytidylyltransferase
MKEFFTRAIFALIYGSTLLFGTYYSKHSFYALFFIIMLLCLKEFKQLIKFSKKWIYVIAILLYLSFTNYFNGYIIYSFTIIGVVIPFVNYFLNAKISKEDISNFFLSTIYIILPFGLLLRIPFSQGAYNPTILIAVFGFIWTNDTFAYIVGKSIGKHKLIERISPNKTIEGFIGGLIATNVLGYFLAQHYNELSLTHWFLLANISGIFAVMGDLVESKFKRLANVKDSAKVIPGHGGFLDRLDSLILVAPFVYLFLQLV